MKKRKDKIEVSTDFLCQVIHVLSYADGYLQGIGKGDVYISDQANAIVSDLMRLFENDKPAV